MKIEWPIKFLAQIVSLTIKFNNCMSTEQSENRCFTDGCQGLTEHGESFDLQRKQKRPRKPARGGGCCNKSCLAHGVLDN